MRTLTTLPVAFALYLAATGTQASADPVDLSGPPAVTAVGCDVTKTWDAEYVREVLGTTESVVRRMQKRFSHTPFRICTGDPKEIARLAQRAQEERHRFDQPDKAIEFRRLSLIDDSGEVRPDGLSAALQQRDVIVRGNPGAGIAGDAGISSASWTSLGPTNVGGRIRAIAVHPTTTTRILVGSVSGGIWKSTNSGASFAVVNDFLANVAVSCLVHDPVTPNTMYACTGEGPFYDSIRGLGIFKSTDGGDTWSLMASTNPTLANDAANPDRSAFFYVNRLAIHPTTPATMLAATNRGVFRTTDGGANWAQVYGTGIVGCANGRRRAYDIQFDRANGNRAVLGESSYSDCTTTVGGSIAYSLDGGSSWTRVPLSGNGRVEIAQAPSSVSGGVTQTWYASNNNANGEIWRSTDGGQSWTLRSALAHLAGQGFYDNTIVVAPNDANKILVGGVSMYLSADGGVNLQRVCNVHVDHHALVPHPGYASNGLVYGGNDGGLYSFSGVGAATTAGTGLNNTCQGTITTTNLNNGLAITQFYGGAGGTVPVSRLAGGTQDNGSYVYNYGTATWTPVFGGDGAEGAVDHADSLYSYGATQYLGVHRSSNGGASAYSSVEICAGITDADCTFGANPNPTTNFISPLMLDPSNANRLYAGAASLWRTDNAKSSPPTWTAVKPPAGAYNYISHVAIAPSNSSVAWVGHNTGALYRTQNATAASPVWTEIPSPAARQVLRILIDKDDPTRVYVTFGGYTSPNVYLATNGLDATPAWTSKHGNLPQAPVRSLARHPSNALWLYAGTEVGVFTSQDGGTTWSATNDGPGTVSAEELFFLNANTLIASTHGRGMFQATVTPPASAPGAVQLDVATVSAAESGGPITVYVSRLGGSNGAASVNYATGTTGTGAGHATPGADFTATSGTLNWASGDSTVRSITIPIIADALVEGNETFTLALSGAAGATLGSPAVAIITIIDPDAFPVNCAIPAGWIVPVTANAGWSVASDQKFEGSCSLKSGAIGNGQKAQVQFTGNFTAGNITFRRKVSSENGWDFFRVYLDGVVRTPDCFEGVANCQGATVTGPTASGETDWSQPSAVLSFPVTAGSHTITFSYEKDASCCVAGSDAAWIDAVSLPLKPSNPAFPDFNADGKPDIIWSNTATGATYVWRMNGPALLSDSFYATIDPSWKIQGVADFNGDGHPDIVWRNTANGACYVWYTVNGVFTGQDAFLFSLPPEWVIQGVADFNADGKPDFLMRNVNSGNAFAWFFNDNVPIGDQFLFNIDPSWKVEAVGDIDLDGQPDLLFRSTTSGLSFAWYTQYSGGVLSLGGSSPMIYSIDPVWEVMQLADWNGDGKPDLLFRNSATGLVFIWYLDGVALGASDYVIQIDPSWEIVPRR
ncbi:MAG: VCBS repeat-containing protein [Betaproteobacteria bacterium]|nr:VCBS repeat-containing protein [Betaproteobacteria bacterium]